MFYFKIIKSNWENNHRQSIYNSSFIDTFLNSLQQHNQSHSGKADTDIISKICFSKVKLNQLSQFFILGPHFYWLSALFRWKQWKLFLSLEIQKRSYSSQLCHGNRKFMWWQPTTCNPLIGKPSRICLRASSHFTPRAKLPICWPTSTQHVLRQVLNHCLCILLACASTNF